MSEKKLYAVKNDKGEWLSFDSSHESVWYTNNPTFFKDKSYAEAQSIGRNANVVKLTEEQKVKLPREVGEELDDYQAEDIDLLDYLHDVIDSDELRVTRVWMLHDREHRIGILADAYRYGWEAEKEAMYNVSVEIQHVLPTFWFFVTADGMLDVTHDKRKAKQFSILEIDRYGLQNYKRVKVTDDAD